MMINFPPAPGRPYILNNLILGFHSTGHFVVMIWKILVNDILRFASIMVIFLMAFSTALFVVLVAPEDRTSSGFWSQVLQCFQLLTSGGFDMEAYPNTEGAMRSTVVTLLVWYTVLGAVVLFNLLIAMMGDTYNR